ncbi:MAG TPA: hypothetical protein VIJ75_12470 [Hanamia sp.]
MNTIPSELNPERPPERIYSGSGDMIIENENNEAGKPGTGDIFLFKKQMEIGKLKTRNLRYLLVY